MAVKIRLVTKSLSNAIDHDSEPCPYDCGALLVIPGSNPDWLQCPNCGQVFYADDSDSDYVAWHGYTEAQAQKRKIAPPPNGEVQPAIQTQFMPEYVQKEYLAIKAAGGANWRAKANQIIKGLLSRNKAGKFARATPYAAKKTNEVLDKALGGGDFSAGADMKTVNFERKEFTTEEFLEFMKAANVHAKAGETIAGNLVRGNDGKFAAGGASPAPKKKGTKPSDVAKKTRQDLIDKKAHDKDAAKYNDAELAKRDQARADKRADQTSTNDEANKAGKDAARSNRGDISDNLLGDDSEAINVMFDNEDGINAEHGDNNDQLSPEYAQHLIDKGLAEKDSDGHLQLSKAGKAYKKAAESGDSDKAKASLDKAAKQKATRDKVATKKAAKVAGGGKKGKAKGGGGKSVIGLSASQKAKFASKETPVEPLKLTVFKGAGGLWRWLLISSNSFQDRDKETISQAAHEFDVERADLDKDYGPLLFWHVPELVIGQCDYSAMHGRMLIESGTFINEEIALAVQKEAGKLGASVGFRTFLNQPVNKVYQFIRKKERSLLPAQRASNIFTKLFFNSKEKSMLPDKLKGLIDLLAASNGGDKMAALQSVASITDNAAAIEKAAIEAGIVTKEVNGKLVIKADMPEGSPEEEAAESPEEEATESDEVIDLTVDDLRQMITEIVQTGLTEFASQLQTAIGGGAAMTKESRQEEITAAVNAALNPALDKLRQEFTSQVEPVKAKVKAMAGETPRYFSELRASADPSNIVKEAAKPPEPAQDPFDKMAAALGLAK